MVYTILTRTSTFKLRSHYHAQYFANFCFQARNKRIRIKECLYLGLQKCSSKLVINAFRHFKVEAAWKFDE